MHAQPHNQAVRDAIWTGRELLLLSGANNLFVVQPKRGRLRYFDYAGPAAGIVATERGLLAFGGEPMTRRTGVHPFGKQWAWITPAGVDVDWSDPDYVVVAAHGAAGDVLALDADGALRSEPHGSSTVWEPALALPEDGHWLDFLSVHDEIVAWGPNRLVLVRTDGTQTERQVVVAPTAPPSALPPGPDVELVGLERHAHGFVLPTSDPLTKPLRRHYRYFVASVPGSEAAWVDWRRNDLLMRWTDDTHTRLEPTPFDNARDADALADQTLLVVADDGVWRFDVEQDHATHMVVDDSPTSVAVDGCGRAWMAGRTLWQLTDSTWTPVETVPPVPDGLWTPFAATPTGIRTRNLEITVPCESAPEAAP